MESPQSQKKPGKRILFINPAKADNFFVYRIHMGFTLLGDILVKKGHQVQIVDYAFLQSFKDKIRVPTVDEIIKDFSPDMIGICVFTYCYDECQSLIDHIARLYNLPIILGGPHLTSFPEDFVNDSRVSYIVMGEAEKVIVDLVESAKSEAKPVIITCPRPAVDDIPAVNLAIAYGSDLLNAYQIQLSRGCPYRCVFCNVKHIAGQQVRARDVQTCVAQIAEAVRTHPAINTIFITDDCPTFDMGRFKLFLKLFARAQTGCNIWIDNLRANLIDEELIQLYKEAGGMNICLGVESGDPKIFETINKGESLADIIEAARLIKKYKLELGLCFVIGLPNDNLSSHKMSMKFAKTLKPDYIFWNMCVPWPNTDVYQWFKQHGEIGRPHNFSTLIDPQANFKEPVCSSIDFSKEDRIKAWLLANMETHNYFTKPDAFPKLIVSAFRYKLFQYVLIYSLKYLQSRIRYYKNRIIQICASNLFHSKSARLDD